MLVLSRKESESILIGDNIRITIIAAADGRARLGIDAPRHVHILREELSRDAYREVSAHDRAVRDSGSRETQSTNPAPAMPAPAMPASSNPAPAMPASSIPAATPSLAPRIARPEPAPSRLPLGNMLAAVMASGALGTNSAG